MLRAQKLSIKYFKKRRYILILFKFIAYLLGEKNTHDSQKLKYFLFFVKNLSNHKLIITL